MNGATVEQPAARAASVSATEIDPDDAQVVPAAFVGLVEAAHSVLRAVEVNAAYTPQDAVSTMEQTAAVLHRLSGHFDLYVGDFSAEGAKAMRGARDLLGQVRSQLSDARNHLAMDDPPSTVPLNEADTPAA